MPVRTLATLLVVVLMVGSGRTQAAGCRDLTACLHELREIAHMSESWQGMGPREVDAKRRVLAMPGAVDALIPLLKDPDERVAELASFVLRDAPTIDPRYLPQIVEGLDRGLGWLPVALARIGTDEAAKIAMDRYMASGSSGNQEAFAVELMGERSVPLILERAACRVPCSSKTHYLLGAVLKDMGPERAAAGPGLLRIASDPQTPPDVVPKVLGLIPDLGSDGIALEAPLLEERARSPELARWIDNALVGIGSSQAGRIFIDRLTARPDLLTLRDLAEVGPAGREAAPTVLDILAREPTLRVPAIVTLGFIDNGQATPALIAALDDRQDARVAWAAANALGRLHAKEALPALDRVAERHWYPPARDAARAASQRIRSESPADNPRSMRNFPAAFFAYEHTNHGLDECPRPYVLRRESTATKLHADTAREALERMAYMAEVVGYGPEGEAREKTRQVPDVALRVADGWLVGVSRGEWGGELGFVRDDGRFQQILASNVDDIHRLDDRIVVTVGLAHLVSSHGAVMALTRDSNGRWLADEWRSLPAAPAMSAIDGDALIVNLVGGGAVRIDAMGGMRMADCTEIGFPPAP